MKRKVLAMFCATIMALGMIACGSSSESSTADNLSVGSVSAGSSTEEKSLSGDVSDEAVNIKIALITMDSIADYWMDLKTGVEEEIAKYNDEGSDIEFTWLAPETQDTQQQIARIESAISDQADYILIAVTDATACNFALQEAMDQGIKVIYVDAPADLDASATYSTNNYNGGIETGEELKALLDEKGITKGLIGIIDAQPGVDSCQDRYDGIMSVFEGTDFTFSERQYSEGDIAKAQELSNVLANNNAIAFIGLNNNASSGAAAAAVDAKNNGKDIIVVGWDVTDANLEYVKSGAISALFAQDPATMGRMGVDAAVALARGETVDSEPVDTGVSVITAENVADYE